MNTEYNLELLTYLYPSKVCKGVGVFALIDIPRDTCIFKPSPSKKISWDLLDKRLREKIECLTHCDEEGFWISCDLNNINSEYYINHSYNFNVLQKPDVFGGALYAIRDIKKDEELLTYYFPEDRNW